MKIAGVTVLYNPNEEVISNIKSYVDQLEQLYLIDNSDHSNEELLSEVLTNPAVSYFPNHENLGIAKVLNLAAEKALENDFDYLFTIDQDSSAPDDLIKNMLKAVEGIEKIGIISPVHQNKFDTIKPAEENVVDRLTVKTSGNLLNLKAYEQVGGFKEEYFIDYVDIEYCMRLWKNGLKVLEVSNAILTHSEADLDKRKIFKWTVYPYNHSPIRMYYKCRNRFYLLKDYGKKFPQYFNYEKSHFYNNFIKIILFEKNKILKFKMSLKGFIDYYRKKTGKIS